MAEVEAGSREYHLHRKLDALMVLVVDMHSHQNPAEQKPASMADAKDRIENRKFNDNNGKNGLQQLCDWTSWVTTVIFLSGSYFVIYGKWLESNELKAQLVGPAMEVEEGGQALTYERGAHSLPDIPTSRSP